MLPPFRFFKPMFAARFVSLAAATLAAVWLAVVGVTAQRNEPSRSRGITRR
jgi:hypothetical protein